MNAIICDLDGTLALPQGRDFYDASDCEKDLINEPVAEIIKRFYPDTMIIFVTGRSDKYKYQTDNWLRRIFKDKTYNLFMRKHGDVRQDSMVKEEIYGIRIKPYFKVSFVLDDRLSVCKMWHEQGLLLLRVGDPEAIF